MFGEQQTDDQDYQHLLLAPPNEQEQKILGELYQAYNSRRWDGDRDSWTGVIPDKAWSLIVSDKHSCSRSIKEHQQCPFHLARERIKTLDVLVVNHALLLADLELGGGIILNKPDETIYVLDEGHHLPQITRDFAAAQATTKGAKDWLSKLPETAKKLNRTLTTERAIGVSLKIQDAADDATKLLDETAKWLEHNHHTLFANAESKNEQLVLRFENGELPEPLLHKAEDLTPLLTTLVSQVDKFQELLKEEVSDENIKNEDAEPLFAELGFFAQRLENLHKLWSQCRSASKKPTSIGEVARR